MKPDFSDFLIVAGVVVVGVGLWWMYPPAALIFGGVALIALGMSLA
jgi:hypothetical protein